MEPGSWVIDKGKPNGANPGFRVDMPVGRVARYPKGNGEPVAPRAPRVA